MNSKTFPMIASYPMVANENRKQQLFLSFEDAPLGQNKAEIEKSVFFFNRAIDRSRWRDADHPSRDSSDTSCRFLRALQTRIFVVLDHTQE